jgi:hypothetical protein
LPPEDFEAVFIFKAVAVPYVSLVSETVEEGVYVR